MSELVKSRAAAALDIYGFVNNFYSIEDAHSIVGEARMIMVRYKAQKHFLSRMDVQDMMDDLAILRNQMGEIDADLKQFAMELEDDWKRSKNELQDELEAELRANKIPGAEDKSKRRAETGTHEKRVNISKAKGVEALFANHIKTIEQVLFAMGRRIVLLAGDPVENRRTAEQTGHEENSDNYTALLTLSIDQGEKLEEGLEDLEEFEQ